MGNKVVYTALLLTPESRTRLAARYPGVHPNKFGEHVTLEFGPKMMPDNIGDEVVFEVIGYRKDERGEAVVVNLNTVRSKNEIPHITISTAEGVKPFYSNEMLDRKLENYRFGYEPIESFKLKGIISANMGGNNWITKPM